MKMGRIESSFSTKWLVGGVRDTEHTEPPEAGFILSSATAKTRNKTHRGSHATESQSLKYTMAKHIEHHVLRGTHASLAMHNFCMGNCMFDSSPAGTMCGNVNI